MSRVGQLWQSLRFAPLAIALLFLSGITPANAQMEFDIDRSTLEAWIFQGNGAQSQRDAKSALESAVRVKVQALTNEFGLTETQRETLLLAARGDMKRFFDRVTRCFAQVEGMQMDEDGFQKAWEMTLPLQQELRKGLFEEDSLFTKVLHRTLTAEQSQQVREAEEMRDRQRTEAIVNAYIAMLDTQIPMLAKQRSQLSEMLRDAITKLPKDQDEYMMMMVVYHAGRLPREKLLEIFDEEQMKALDRLGSEMEGAEEWMREEGLLVEPAGEED